jgi:DNA-binding CsgD family transcriptional regulator
VLKLAGQAHTQQWGSEQSAWLDRLDLEHANIRAALQHCLAAPGAADRGLAICASLFLFWSTRAADEGRRWLDLLLQADTAATPARARALAVNGALATTQNDSRGGRPLLEEALALSRQLRLTDVVLFSLRYLTISAVYDDDLAKARQYAEDGLRLARTAGSRIEIAHLTIAAGGTAAVAEDHDRAGPMLEQGIRLSRELGERWNLAYGLWLLGFSRWRHGHFGEAEELEGEALELARASNDRIGACLIMETLAWVTASTHGARQAARLLGTAQADRDALSFSLFPGWQRHHERCESQLRAELGRAAFDGAMAAGVAMSPERALAGTLNRRTDTAPRQPTREFSPLTPRQMEIAQLVAAGRSNKQIAMQLVIDSRTVESHVYNILSRLGLSSRVQIATWVTERSPDRRA